MERVKALVNYVLDGDTISVTDFKGNTFISRARWIDAPETKKPNQSSTEEWAINHWQWGARSKEFLSQIIQTGSNIILYNYEPDQYGRILSDWYVNSTALKNNLQCQLISQGLACPFLPFNKYDFSISRELTLYTAIIKATASAYKNNIGFWADYKVGKFMLPYEFKNAMTAVELKAIENPKIKLITKFIDDLKSL